MWPAMILLVAAYSPLPVHAQDASAGAVAPVIVTHGEATVRRAPDQAFVTAAIESRARTPRDAQRQNAAAMTTLLDQVLAAGISRDDVRTLGYSIHQDVDVVDGRRVPRDFVARNAVEVRVDAIERTGEIIDTLAKGGATAVDRVRFDLKERAAVERDALRLAVLDARARAEAAAAGAGRTVGRVLRVEDTRQPEYRAPYAMASLRGGAEAVTTPIEPATIEIRATATLTVALP
ncbi:MAG: SIMPL domain-containing protein [Vicinamibacterales bacterium]